MKSIPLTAFVLSLLSVSTASQVPPPSRPGPPPPSSSTRRDQPAPPPPPLIYSPPASSEIEDFTPTTKLFSARFPGKPSESNRNVNDAVITTYRVYRKGSNSVVAVTETMTLLANRSEEAFRLIKESIEQNGGKIERESEIVVGDWTGKEFGFRQDLGFRRLRVFIVGARILEIQSDVTNWHIISDKVKDEWNKETQRFFDSFKIN